MAHPIHCVTGFEIVGPYRLRVDFSDSTSQTIDFLPVLSGELYGPLKDMGVFNRVGIDPVARTLVWPTGADFDPAVLHAWTEHKDAFIRLVQSWDRVRA